MLIERINKQEMMRCWAVGEVCGEFLNALNEGPLKQVLAWLKSGNLELERKAIFSVLKSHHLSLLDFIPEDTQWYKALLMVDKISFNQLNVLPVRELAAISNYTYRVCYAANILRKNPELNERISYIAETMRDNNRPVQLSGITLFAKNQKGPYTIIEGNGRLISLYIIQLLEDRNIIENGWIEVVLGISEAGLV